MLELWIACVNCKKPLAKAEPLPGIEILCFAAKCPKCYSTCGLKSTKYKLVRQKQPPVYEGDQMAERILTQQSWTIMTYRNHLGRVTSGQGYATIIELEGTRAAGVKNKNCRKCGISFVAFKQVVSKRSAHSRKYYCLKCAKLLNITEWYEWE